MSSDTNKAGGVEITQDRVLSILEQCEAVMKSQPAATPATVATQLRIMADAVQAGEIPIGDLVCLWNAPEATFVHIVTRGMSPIAVAGMFLFHARHLINDDAALMHLTASTICGNRMECTLGTISDDEPTQH